MGGSAKWQVSNSGISRSNSGRRRSFTISRWKSSRRVHRLSRPVGLRQVDPAAHDRRARGRRAPARSTSGHAVSTRRAPGERGVAMVFQHYALYPHMTVRENMAFGLRNIGTAQGRDRAAACRPPRRCWRWTRCWSGVRASFRAASASASPSAAPSSRSRAPFCSTSRSPISTRRCAAAPGSSCRGCTSACAPPWSSSPTTRSRR